MDTTIHRAGRDRGGMRATRSALRARAACLLLGLAGIPAASADSWAPPEPRVVASPDARLVLRIEPGRRSAPARPAHARLYRLDPSLDRYALQRDWALPDPVAPVDALLTDDGTLVTLDRWGNAGHGQVLAIHGADGRLRHAFTLAQLLGTRATTAPATTSSIWWRCGAPRLAAGDTRLQVTTFDDGELDVELASGRVHYTPGNGRCG